MEERVDAELQKSLVGVHRVGEEGLFEILVEENLSTLELCKFETVVTTDSHLFNTVRNE